MGLATRLPVLTTQETFRLGHFADRLSPARAPTPMATHAGAPFNISNASLQSQITDTTSRKSVDQLRSISKSPVIVTSPPAGAMGGGAGAGSGGGVPASSVAVYDRTLSEVGKFIDAEMAILGACDDGAASEPGMQRLTIFKEAFRMLLPMLVPNVSKALQRIMREYDKFLMDVERQTVSVTQKRERERLEQHYQRHFMEEALIKETQLQLREADFAVRESDMTLKLRQLENQLYSMREESRVLRQQQNDDTEKYMTMAQAVVESRLTAQRGDLAMHELREFQAKRDQLEKNQKLLLEDATAMYNTLKKNNIPFTTSGNFLYETD